MTLRFSDVSFRYGRGHWVFEQFGFSFPSGSTVLLGPNGAGKSTLLGLGASILRPRRGTVSLDGLRSRGLRYRAQYRRRVMWMPQQIRPIPGLTAREQAAYVGWLKGLSEGEARAASDGALATVGLERQAETRADKLSGGQLQRLGVAQAIVHDADVLLMDEPTAGLDPEQRARFRALIAHLRAASDLVVSTHQTEDIVDSYDTVVVLAEGRVLFTGTVPEFLEHAPEGTSELRRAEAAYAHIMGLGVGCSA